MKMCHRHWDALKAEVDRLGMSHLIAKDGEEEAVERALRGTDDPLMRCYWMIANRATEAIGLDLLVIGPNGEEKCPQCEYNARCGCPTPNCAEEWTTSAPLAVLKWIAEESGRQA